jgi:hypothetical protein
MAGWDSGDLYEQCLSLIPIKILKIAKKLIKTPETGRFWAKKWPGLPPAATGPSTNA